jgi:hypothetical protein
MSECRRWILWKTVTHPKLKEPIQSSVLMHGTPAQVVKNLLVDAKTAIALRRELKHTFVDRRGGTIELRLEPVSTQGFAPVVREDDDRGLLKASTLVGFLGRLFRKGA